MIIRLSKQQQDALLAWSGKINWGHFLEECEPPGYDLVIVVSHLGESYAEGRCGPSKLELGEVEVTIE